jgi:redox-sensitive bicupin YhaK (pirin superfamily)
MSTVRKIAKVRKSRPTLEGAGVHLKRAFSNDLARELDPFLLLDDFHSGNPEDYLPGFPWHPHRGIETITYMLEGTIEHGDSMGNKGTIHPGYVQWMTAGGGIIHQEMPKGGKDGRMWGFQLWANLPATQKMMKPRYRDVTRDQIPEVKLDGGASVRIVSGTVQGIRGPVQDIVTDPEYLDVSMPPKGGFTHKVPKGYTAFAYIVEGKGYFDPERDPFGYEMQGANYFDTKRERTLEPESLVIFADGDEVAISTEAEGVRFLLVSGKPIGEPIAWYGPIVMNTQAELRQAFDELERGTFLGRSGAG